ncbi:MAG TPA: carboxypeptidase-like regulatory domain-containing protein [Terriglobales bacterium]|nr:carboxypeptidase-like regulatory domain-containing protein [Terriglobales bacterium]
MKSAALAVIIACCSVSTAQTATISGVVRDSVGAVIPNADVFVHWNLGLPNGPRSPKSKDLRVTTDKLGLYSAVVTPGYYDVCVHSTTFSPVCTTLKVEQRSATYNPQLKVNPLIGSEIGDVVPTGGPAVNPPH